MVRIPGPGGSPVRETRPVVPEPEVRTDTGQVAVQPQVMGRPMPTEPTEVQPEVPQSEPADAVPMSDNDPGIRGYAIYIGGMSGKIVLNDVVLDVEKVTEERQVIAQHWTFSNANGETVMEFSVPTGTAWGLEYL